MRTPAPTIVIAAIAVTALSGCIGTAPPQPPVATIDTVAVPDAMLSAEASVTMDTRILPGTETVPMLIGGSSGEPGEGERPTVWTSVDGSTWEPQDVADVEGDFTGSIAGTADLAVLGGGVWADGATTSVLWSSEDRETWTEVELPESFAATFRVFDVAVAGSTIYAIGGNASGEEHAVRIDGEDVSDIELPAVDEGEMRGTSQLLAFGDILILFGSPGPEGDPAATVSHVSDDGGKTWSEAGTIVESPGFVAGIAAVDGGYVATGGSIRSGSNATDAAAWFSPDGLAWTAESVPAFTEGPLFTSLNSDVWFGIPLAGQFGVSVVLGNDNASMSGIFTRSADGAWTLAGLTDTNSTNGGGGSALNVDGTTIVGMLGSAPYARLGTFAGGAWTTVAVLAPREDVARPSTIYPADDRSLITVITSKFTAGAEYEWSNTTSYQLGELSDDTLSLVAWDPARAGELSSVVLGTDDDGAEVLLGSYFNHDAGTIAPEGWFRADPSAEWTPVTGFPTTGATSLASVQKIGDQWVAVGDARASSVVGQSEHGVVWVSADGITWAAPSGDFGDGVLETSIADVCALPDGSGLAIGWREESAGEYRTAVWASSDAGWTQVDIGDLGETNGYGTDCASDDEGVILAAHVSGRDTLQRSTDGAAWEEVFRAERGVYLGELAAVPGGFAASGSLTTESFTGPVVWISADGVAWSPLAIPSFRDGSTIAVAPYGDDLLVTMHPRVGHPVSIIRDIERTIADYTR